MFATGAFTADGLTIQKYHDKEPFDDDVVSRISETYKASFPDGYVSNIGSTVTIHIKKELNTADTIEFIKKIFFLNSPDLTVSIEPLFGW